MNNSFAKRFTLAIVFAVGAMVGMCYAKEDVKDANKKSLSVEQRDALFSLFDSTADELQHADGKPITQKEKELALVLVRSLLARAFRPSQSDPYPANPPSYHALYLEDIQKCVCVIKRCIDELKEKIGCPNPDLDCENLTCDELQTVFDLLLCECRNLEKVSSKVCVVESKVDDLGVTICDKAETIIEQLGVTMCDKADEIIMEMWIHHEDTQQTICAKAETVIEQLGTTICDKTESIVTELGQTVCDKASSVTEQLGVTMCDKADEIIMEMWIHHEDTQQTICAKTETVIEELGHTVCDKVNSAIDALGVTICDKVEAISVSACDLTGVESKLCVVDSKIDALQLSVTDVVCDLDPVIETVKESASSVVEQLGVTICDKAESVVVELGQTIVDSSDMILSKLCMVESVVDGADDCGATAIFGPTTINVPGNYCLANDIAGTITIDANLVTLDLNGYNIDGTGPSAGILVLSGDHLVFKNGFLAGPGSNNGIDLTGGVNSDIRIENLTISNWASGIAFTTVQDFDVRNVQIVGGTDSFTVLNSVRGLIKDCLFNGSTGHGLMLAGSLGSQSRCVQVVGCVAQDNGTDGFVTSDVSEILFKDCFACSSGQQGFESSLSNDVCFVDCTAKACQNGFFVVLSGTDGVVIQSCTATGNATDGFSITSISSLAYAFVRQCTATDNGTGFDIGGTGSFEFYENIACNNTTNYSGVSSAPIKSPADARGQHNVDCTLTNEDTVDVTFSKLCVVDSKIDALQLSVTDVVCDLDPVIETVKESASSVVEQLGVTICDKVEAISVSACDLTGVESKLCVVDSKIDALALSQVDVPCAAIPITESTTILESGTYCLANDVGHIVIDTSNVTLDLNGLRVTGEDPGSGFVGIDVREAICVTIRNGFISPIESLETDFPLVGNGINILGSVVTIEKVFIKGFDTGVFSEKESSIITLDNVECAANTIGAHFCDTVDITIRNSSFTNSEKELFFEICNSVVVDNSFLTTGESPVLTDAVGRISFHAVGSNYVTARNVTATLVGSDADGFVFEPSSGSDVEPCRNVLVENCTAFNFDYGFRAIDVDNLCITESKAKGNQQGFSLEGDETTALVQRCSALGNTTFGFSQSGSGVYEFYKNVACDNGVSDDANYVGITSAPIASPANARGQHNVDCSLDDSDAVGIIESKVCLLSACAAHQITEATTISNSGTYCLGNDIQEITIDGSCITLDLNGYTVTGAQASGVDAGIIVTGTSEAIIIKNGCVINDVPGTDADTTVGIHLENGTQNVTITNVTVAQWETGVSGEGVSKLIIDNVRICDNTVNGILIGAEGTEEIESRDIVIRNSQIGNNINYGIRIDRGHSVLIQECVLSDNGSELLPVSPTFPAGIFLRSCVCAKVISCSVSTQLNIPTDAIISIGISIINFSDSIRSQDIIVKDCFACGYDIGFQGGASENICFFGCTAKGNDAGYFLGGTDLQALVRRCVAIDNDTFGFLRTSGEVQMYENVACYNGTNYSGFTSASIKSPADARGQQNVDCSLTDEDSVDAILSKVCVTESKIGDLDVTISEPMVSALETLADINNLDVPVTELLKLILAKVSGL